MVAKVYVYVNNLQIFVCYLIIGTIFNVLLVGLWIIYINDNLFVVITNNTIIDLYKIKTKT